MGALPPSARSCTRAAAARARRGRVPASSTASCAEQGPIINAYWCTSEASAVAITEKQGDKSSGSGSCGASRPNIRFHAATDWATRDAPEISHALHTTETLAIRVSEVLSGTSERIAMQWLLSIGGYLLSVVDGQREEGQSPGARQGGEPRARRAGPGRVLLRPRGGEDGAARLLLGDADRNPRAGAARRPGALIATDLREPRSRDEAPRTFFVCYAMGAVGAIVSVMMRMASKSGAGFIDYEVGRPSLRRVGSFRPIIGAVFGVVVYFALKSGLIQLSTGRERPVAIYFYATLAFIAGFSERRAMVILGGAERMLGGRRRRRRRGDRSRAAGGRPTTARRQEGPLERGGRNRRARERRARPDRPSG